MQYIMSDAELQQKIAAARRDERRRYLSDLGINHLLNEGPCNVCGASVEQIDDGLVTVFCSVRAEKMAAAAARRNFPTGLSTKAGEMEEPSA